VTNAEGGNERQDVQEVEEIERKRKEEGRKEGESSSGIR
jgi:hypothetical protein